MTSTTDLDSVAVTGPLPARREQNSARADAVVDIVVPVHNEETDLAPSIRRLDGYLATEFPYPYRITIADNASTDGTWPEATRLATELGRVHAVHLADQGRGRALKAVWSASSAPVLAYMDVDLSTDLRALLPLVAPLISGHSDLAIGTRLSSASRVVRGPKREFVSRSYNLLLKGHAGRVVLRRAVRLQGHPGRRRRASAPAGGGPPVVLRHRAAGARPAGRVADPRGAGRLGR